MQNYQQNQQPSDQNVNQNSATFDPSMQTPQNYQVQNQPQGTQQPINYANQDGNSPFYQSVQDDQVSQTQQNQIQPITVTGSGSVETSPVSVAPEQSSQGVEYGYDKLKQIERISENLQQIENKEIRNNQSDDQQPQQQQQPQNIVPPTKPQGPKIFGYYIPPVITSNIAAIRQNKGTGNPQDAKTWIYVLLDRLLKKQTYKD